MADKSSTEQRFGLFPDNMFNSKEFQEVFQKHWHENMKMCHQSSDFCLNFYPKPFRHCKISQFIRNEVFLYDLIIEVSKLSHVRLTSDLYKFTKTKDLSKASGDNIKLFYKAFQLDLGSWLERNTGIELNKKVTMTSSNYHNTDYLLCHDDNMHRTRKIAFILYLHRDWDPYDGGGLDIFDTDEYGQPNKIVRTIHPTHNSLVFFEVSDKSYHQVAEITATEKFRWSINGWFHGPVRDDEKEIVIKLRPENVFSEPRAEMNLKSWINSSYLSFNVIEEIHETVEQNSFILISDFVKPMMFEMLTNALQAEDITWQWVGPPNLRAYEIADEETLPLCLKQFLNVFKSKSFFRLLTKYTGISLKPDRQIMKPTVAIELQRWSKGCYTLLCDTRKLSSTKKDSTRVARPLDDTSLGNSTDVTSPSKTDAESSQSNQNERNISTSSYDSIFEEVNLIISDSTRVARPLDDTSLRNSTDATSSSDVASPSKTDAESSQSNRNERNISTSSSDGTCEKLVYCRSTSDDTSLSNTTYATSSSNVASSSKSDAKSSQTNRNKRTISGSDSICEKVAKYSDSQKDITNSSNTNEKANDAELTKEPREEVTDDSSIEDYLSSSTDNSSIEDYLSSDELNNESSNNDYTSNDDSTSSDDSNAEYVLDVILQFCNKLSNKLSTFDYVDPSDKNGVFIQIPKKDNHLSIVYRQMQIYRFQPYINHLFDGYFYNLVCTYRE